MKATRASGVSSWCGVVWRACSGPVLPNRFMSSARVRSGLREQIENCESIYKGCRFKPCLSAKPAGVAVAGLVLLKRAHDNQRTPTLAAKMSRMPNVALRPTSSTERNDFRERHRVRMCGEGWGLT